MTTYPNHLRKHRHMCLADHVQKPSLAIVEADEHQTSRVRRDELLRVVTCFLVLTHANQKRFGELEQDDDRNVKHN